MHIPDGFLSTPVWLTLNAVGAPAVGLLARRAQRESGDIKAPLLGVMGAFVFAAQMINFPVGMGTSGHLVGSALLAYTVGPAAAAVVMTAILALQALVFQDGGILALGANVFNMAIVGVMAAYLPYRQFGRGRMRTFAIFLGGLLSVLTAACLALSELLLSGVRMPGPVVTVSLGLILVCAVAEGAITVAVIRAIERVNAGWIRGPEAMGKPALGFIATAALLLVTLGGLVASSSPDTLESFAEQVGIADQARSLFETPFADYQARFFEADWLAQAAAGLAGLALIFGLGLGLGKLLRNRRAAGRPANAAGGD
ncbi:MAG: energy-coupling factor ABC transporter permease [Bryobacteraceae bacterium]|nr:energy-coupling factor ABC transporter permease [Bryobacteraceae bacterium]